MNAKLWAFAILFYSVWLLAGAVVTWSIYALPRGMPTTSQVMGDAGPLVRFIMIFAAGGVVGFVAGHFWWPISR